MKIYIQLVQENNSWKPVYREDQRPLEYVTWFGATDYCAWRETRLPTEAEWEYSARSPNGYLYPWGNEFVRDNIVFGRNPEAGSRPQGASWVGALDMSGSLFEWTSSLFRPFPYDPSDGREASLEEDRVSNRVFKGSPWYHSLEFTDVFSVSARFDGSPDIAFWYHGFRCALSP